MNFIITALFTTQVFNIVGLF